MIARIILKAKESGESGGIMCVRAHAMPVPVLVPGLPSDEVFSKQARRMSAIGGEPHSAAEKKAQSWSQSQSLVRG